MVFIEIGTAAGTAKMSSTFVLKQTKEFNSHKLRKLSAKMVKIIVELITGGVNRGKIYW